VFAYLIILLVLSFHSLFCEFLGLAYNYTTSLVFLLMEALILICLLMLNDIVEGTSQTNDRNC
jgi:hypothetical protein